MAREHNEIAVRGNSWSVPSHVEWQQGHHRPQDYVRCASLSAVRQAAQSGQQSDLQSLMVFIVYPSSG